MKSRILIFAVVIMGFVLMLTNSCKKEKEEVPVLTTTAVTAITQTTAASGANITSDGGAAVTARGVCWGTAATPTIADSKTSNGTGIGVFTSALTGLTPGATYYVRGYATNSAGTAYGTAKTFIALPLLGPVVVTKAVTNVAQTTATSGGRITSDGGADVTAKGVCWSTSATPTIADSKTADGTDTASFVSNITGLTASTTYYVRAYATNSVGTTYGTAVSFTTTAAPIVPTVTTTAVTAITQTTAASGGSVSADGGAAVTEKGVCWSTSATPTVADSKTLDGTGTDAFTSDITGLTASTTYYVRAYATNSVGTGYGDAVSFTTLAVPVAPTVTTTAITSITLATAASGGVISSDGGAAVTAKGVCWSTSATPTIADSKTTDGTGTATFTSNITSLTASTTYYVRAYATNSAGTGYGTAVSFTTSAAPVVPILTTTAVTAITQTTAASGGSITSDGGAAITAKGICWSTSATPTITDSNTTDGTGTDSFTSSLTGLTGATTYYVSAYATNSVGTAYGTPVSFTTLAPATPPVLTTNDIVFIGHATATSGGKITADGGSAVTARGVCWSTSTSPSITDSHTSDLTGIGTFKSAISGLSITTTYYVRAYATNSAGTGYGEEKSFTTWNTPILDIDGNEYHEVVIGTQTWLVENLRTKHYRNGDPIPNLKLDADWAADVTGAWVYNFNDSLTYQDRGLYYNRHTTVDPRGLAIAGYHVPSYAECAVLQTFLGGKPLAGGPMKEVGTTHWYTPNEGATNSSGFTSIPSGRRNANGTFVTSVTGNSYFWTTSVISATLGTGTTMVMAFNTTIFGDTTQDYKVGIPIRLIKD